MAAAVLQRAALRQRPAGLARHRRAGRSAADGARRTAPRSPAPGMAAQPHQAWRWPDSDRLPPCLRVSWRDPGRGCSPARRGRQRTGTGWTWCPRYPSTFGPGGMPLLPPPGPDPRSKPEGDGRMSTPANRTTRASQPGSVPSVRETSYLSRPEGRIGYDVAGGGLLVVLVPGMGDLRAGYRFLAPACGRRVTGSRAPIFAATATAMPRSRPMATRKQRAMSSP